MRIEICGSRENNFIARDAHNSETGEAFDAHGTLWACGSKLCPNCIASQARRNRKKLREAIGKQKLRRGERYSFVTFTIKNPNASLMETRAIVDRAWTLFRKRKMCVDLIRGGVKSEEFTLTANGFHYHLHCIFLSKFVLFNEARRVWTECVEKAYRESGRTLEVNTKDGLLVVKWLPMLDSEKTIQEVCKYITKSDSWSKMRSDDLTDIAMIKRWFRMFELFGCFAMKNEDKPVIDSDSLLESHIVHTRNLTDGVSPSHQTYWRDFVDEHGVEAYAHELNDEVSRCWKARLEQIKLRWPAATIESPLLESGREF